MAAALIGKRKIVPTVASTVIRRWQTTRTVLVSTQQQRFVNHNTNCQHVRRLAAAEKSNCFIPRPRRYGTSPMSATDMKKLSPPTGKYDYDLAVEKAIEHYHNHIKVKDEDGLSRVRGASNCISGVKVFHIVMKTRGGQKYVCIYVAPRIYHPMKLEHDALKLVFFSKVDSNVPLSFRSFVGRTRWSVCPRKNPLITAAARFALALHNKEEKLTHLIRANSQMVGEHEIIRITFEAEFSGESSKYDAIVLVPRKSPEKMELVRFGTSNGWGMYHRRCSSVERYNYEDEDNKEEEEIKEKYDHQYEGDECVIDDPRVTAAARFALSQYNEKDQVRLGNEKDQVRRVVGATRRTYLGDEILSMRFDGELDGSWYYKAIVLVPVNDPENMRLAYCGRNWDDPDPCIPDSYRLLRNPSRRTSFLYGCEECDIDDPWVTEAARRGLALYNKKDKLVRVVKAVRQSKSGGSSVAYTVRFVGEDHPLRTYVAMVSVPDDEYSVRYASKVDPSRTYVAEVCVPREDPKYMCVERVFAEVNGPSRQYVFPEPEVCPKFESEGEVPDNNGLFRDFVSLEITNKK